MPWYPPYWGTGIRIARVHRDFRSLEVRMPLRFYNRNYVGTQFGGSLYSMVDPFYMLMLIENLGPRYHVWDQAAHIRFLRPGSGTVRAVFEITEDMLKAIRDACAGGNKHIARFSVTVVGPDDTAVAAVDKEVYVRLKPKYRPSE